MQPSQRSRASAQPRPPFTLRSAAFSPDAFFDNWNPRRALPAEETDDAADNAGGRNDFRAAVVRAFNLKPDDDYVYHATASVTLAQVQQALNAGRKGGLHAWYRDQDGNEIEPPSRADIDAYTSVFSPFTSTPKALTALGSNAKKGSVCAAVASNLQSKLLLPSSSSSPSNPAAPSLPPKQKPSSSSSSTSSTSPPNTPPNPYLDVWAWTCRALDWAGPTPDTPRHARHSHHVLPVLYHHFGCAVPSPDAIAVLRQLSRPAGRSRPRAVVELGSGNGYWAYALRRAGVPVVAVDNGDAAWRTVWIADTVVADGASFVKKRGGGGGCVDDVLLLVYPPTEAGGFTEKVLRAYKGDAIAVVGTQNEDGYTGFKEEGLAQWMGRERPEFELVMQVPLPSFAGRDEALFVFQTKKEEG
ncbi:hypothetical protein BDY21DRAFT_415907 [Lineolata rhizophorae]|uniref:Uncharacterized protein n=1 Tax=Lineolata rhizophorae TaxID=578093 RepID=A0A6A6NX57_9PEZI|nr:hypothetical protein BDY21DRAFT_415907 [Lineolata rhizophorae]